MTFSIRDLMWLTVVVALAAGWWVEHRQQVTGQEKLRIIYQKEIRSRENEIQALHNDMRTIGARLRGETVLPASQASGEIPPKNQSGPHKRP